VISFGLFSISISAGFKLYMKIVN